MAGCNDGGPAFPGTVQEEYRLPGGELADVRDVAYPGMSLRDFFTGQALAGLLSHGGYASFKDAAIDACTAADAVLAERILPHAKPVRPGRQ
jgi:hypothetical protein